MLVCGAKRLIEKPNDEDYFFTYNNKFGVERLFLGDSTIWYKVGCKYTGDVYLPGDKKVYTNEGLTRVDELKSSDRIKKSFILPDMYLSSIKDHKWYAYQLSALVDGSFYLPYPPLARDLSNMIGEKLQPVSKDIYAANKEINTEGIADKLLTSSVESVLEVIRIFWDVRGEIIPSKKLRIHLYHEDNNVLKCIQFLLLKIGVLSKIYNNKLSVTDWESKKLFLRFIPTYKTIENFNGITPGEGINRKDLFFWDKIYSITLDGNYPSYKNQSQFLIDNTIVK